MTWSKIDDGFYDHPKTVAAGPLGIALFICGLSYSSRYLTDGFIAEAMIRRLIDVDNPQAVAERLVEVGLWEQAEGGYQITQVIRWQISRELGTQEMRKTAKYRTWRRAVVERDESTCKMCGSKSRPLHAHHIKEWVLYPEERFRIENGITLCEVCHSKVHGRRLYGAR